MKHPAPGDQPVPPSAMAHRQETGDKPNLEPAGEECEFCGTEMYGLHCKLVCPNCGYRRDCSDP